jgi:hypothetical protein
MSAKMIWTAPEVAVEEHGPHLFQGFRAYFKAPVNGKYRFLMSCDDTCVLNLSTSTPEDPSAKERLLSRNRPVGWRKFDLLDKSETSKNFGKFFSKEVTLNKDEFYYFETSVLSGRGPMYHVIGMDVIPDQMPKDHPHKETTIQRFSVGQSGLSWDTLEIRVIKPDQGKIVLMYLDPRNDKFIKSGAITAGCSAAEMRAAIKGYYEKIYKQAPSVTLSYQDAAGKDVPYGDAALNAYVYKVELQTAISEPSVTQITTVAITSKSKVEIKYPSDLQLSDPPISGKYYLKCSNTDGATYATNDIDIKSDARAVQRLLESNCSFLKGKITVRQRYDTFPTNKMGVEFEIDFHGVKGSLKVYEAKTSPAEPLEGKNIVFAQKQTRDFGKSLVYKLIPPEYFYTIEESP